MSEPECSVQQPLPYTSRKYYWHYRNTISPQHVRFQVDKLQKEMVELGYPVKYLTWEWDNQPGYYVRGIVVKGLVPEVSLWDCDCKECYLLKREADDFLGENTVPRKYSDYLASMDYPPRAQT